MPVLIVKFEGSVLKKVATNGGSITIGRGPDNSIAIDNLAVSNRHAEIKSEQGGLVVEDLNSLNGTFVNNQRVKRSALKDGDVVETVAAFIGRQERCRIDLDARGRDLSLCGALPPRRRFLVPPWPGSGSPREREQRGALPDNSLSAPRQSRGAFLSLLCINRRTGNSNRSGEK